MIGAADDARSCEERKCLLGKDLEGLAAGRGLARMLLSCRWQQAPVPSGA